MKNHSKTSSRFLMAGLLLLAFAVSGQISRKSESANLTNTSVTLSNSRLSFRGALNSGNTVGSSHVIINTTPNAYPSTSSSQLVEGDAVRIGSAGGLGAYTVASVSSESTFSLTSALGTGHADVGDDVISSQSATLYVRYTTANAIANGKFRILVPALADDAASSDGIPDQANFDFGSSAPTVTCPSNADATYDFVGGVATASAVTIDSQQYHAYTCFYSGTGGVSNDFDSASPAGGNDFDYIQIANVINPAPKTNHTNGTADSYSIIVQHLNNAGSVVDSTTTSVGVIEAVRVTASVAPQISFQIIGVGAGSTAACGITTSVATTPTAVPFGDLYISAFKHAAQSLSVSTNANNGFAVTVLANDQMGLNGTSCAGADGTGLTNCIPDPNGGNTAMDYNVNDAWSSASTTDKGFAYSLDDANSTTTEAFSYNIGTGNCTGSNYCARQFPDNAATEPATTIFSATAPADNDNVYVCYKSIISATQAAGNYENNLTYTATATF